jgi:hypothetical protein
MKIAIMQPYFFPYVGYFKLLAQVDKFVIYDDVQFTKKGWINRNYLSSSSGPWLFSIPVVNASAIELIRDKRIAPEYSRSKLISRIEQNYHKLTSREKMAQVSNIINFDSDNLFEYIEFSLREMSKELNLEINRVIPSSSLGDFRMFKGQEKVLQICKSLNADTYINPVGGKSLYDIDSFETNGIQLIFQEPNQPQLVNPTEEIQQYSFLHDYLTMGDEELRRLILK